MRVRTLVVLTNGPVIRGLLAFLEVRQSEIGTQVSDKVRRSLRLEFADRYECGWTYNFLADEQNLFVGAMHFWKQERERYLVLDLVDAQGPGPSAVT